MIMGGYAAVLHGPGRVPTMDLLPQMCEDMPMSMSQAIQLKIKTNKDVE
jgi:hypothetical protein